MPSVDFVVSSELKRTARVKQLEAMFDVPPSEKTTLHWEGEIAIEEKPWNIGLILGPSGCGKSSVLRKAFGRAKKFKWTADSVIDDFSRKCTIKEIADVCRSVGFNTIPAWMRPQRVLSNGEQFRVDLARRLLELPDPILVDEFTSVVDRQVAKITSHAVQKYIRRENRKFVACSCHYDIVEWLKPDWILEPATMRFRWRSVQRSRPKLRCSIRRVKYDVWHTFAPFHYLTAGLNKSARCFALFIDGKVTTFAGMLRRPHPKVKNVIGCSRLVTLPDYQGLGLAMILIDTLSAAYKSIDERVRTYPAHPSLVRSFGRSENWAQRKHFGQFSPRRGRNSAVGGFGGRHCAVFEYDGSPFAAGTGEARRLLGL